MSRYFKSKVMWAAVIFVVAAMVLLVSGFRCGAFYEKGIITYESLIDDAKSIKDFDAHNGRITSLSDDPWIEYSNSINDVRAVTINVNYLSDNYTDSELFIMYDDGKIDRFAIELEIGSNTIYMYHNTENIDVIRYDLLRGEGQEIGIENVIINDRQALAEPIRQDNMFALLRLCNILACFIPVLLAVFGYALKKKKGLKIAAAAAAVLALGIAAAGAAGVFVLGDNVLPPKELTLNELTDNGNGLKDFEINGNIINAISDDPWITYKGNDLNNIRTVTLDVESLSVESADAEVFVFYEDEDFVCIPAVLKAGEVNITLPNSFKKINNLRFDLTNVIDAKININGITFNKSNVLRELLLQEWFGFCCKLAVWLLFIAVAFFAARFGAVKGKTDSRITAFMYKAGGIIIACLVFIMYVISFYFGIAAFIPAVGICFLIGRYAGAKKVRGSVCAAAAAIAAAAVFIVLPSDVPYKLFFIAENKSGYGIRIFIALVYTLIIACCTAAVYSGNKKENAGFRDISGTVLGGFVFDGAVIVLMTLVIEVTAKLFFEQLKPFNAVEAVIRSEAFYLNVLLIAVIYMFIRGLLGGVLGRLSAVTLYLLWFTGNFVKLKYHDSTLKPMDILQLSDFLNIVTRYIPAPLFYGCLIVLAAVAAVLIIKFRKRIFENKPAFSFALLGFIMIISMSDKIQANAFMDMGFNVQETWLDTKECVRREGVVTYSYIKFRELSQIYPKADENYSKAYMQQLKSEFDTLNDVTADDVKPDVILVMEESLCDVQNMTGVEFSGEIDANINKYEKATVISPKYGGGTGSVEFEALTGMSNYFMLDNVVPYVTYWNSADKEIPSIVREFDANGYSTVAIHPNDGNAYNRDIVYGCMGFDKFLDKQELDFSSENLTNDGYFTDDALADVIEQQLYESQKPAFVFAVTIENHTLYENKYKETEVKVTSDNLSEGELHNLEQYSQGVLNADRFIGKMVDYVDNAERPTILYIWGDHLPSLSAFGTLGYINDKYVKYGTPLIAYSNYKDIEIECEYFTPNQLAPQILRDAQITYNSYFDYIYSLRAKYPVIQKEFDVTADDELIKKYQLIQYDVLFGKKYLLGYD